MSSGDTLALKNKKDAGVEDMLTLGISITYTGLPEDCTFLGEIKANKEMTLEDLKLQILTLPEFEGRSTTNTISECIRLREKMNNQFFGKIYRPGQNKTLKNLGFKNNQSLVV